MSTIGFITEDYWSGGLARFNADLINNWPDKTAAFVVITNRENARLQERITNPRARFVYVGFRTVSSGMGERRGLLKKIYRRSLFKYGFFVARFRALRRLTGEAGADRWIISNGGYPGSDLCRLALFVLKRARGVFVFHGAVQKPWPVFLFPEMLLDRLIWKRATFAVVTVSRANALTLSARPWLNRLRVGVIHNGVGLNSSGEKRSGGPGCRRVVAMCSGLRPYKGQEVIIRVAEQLKEEGLDLEVRFYGEDFDRFTAPLKARIAASRYPGLFSLPGFSPVERIMGEADAVVVPSLTHESFGYTAAEALAAGVPVIVSNVGGLPEVVGDAGIICAPGDVQAWAEAIRGVLGCDASLRQECIRRGRARARERFSIEGMCNAYAELFSTDRGGDQAG